VTEYLSPCGSWRFRVRRLGAKQWPADEFVVLARIAAGGTATVFACDPVGGPRSANWRPAGPLRMVLVAEWLASDGAGRVCIQAAAELSPDGRTCQARVQWRHVDVNGAPLRMTETGEADGKRLQA
jgi:hypothetical protein